MKYFMFGCICLLFSVILIFILVLMFRDKKGKTSKEIKKELEVEKDKQEQKATLRTGDDTDNFNNSVNVLSQLSKSE